MTHSNTENEAWNLLHNGCRVPVNDTGVDGAPAALSSRIPEWANGSLNKAVKTTYELKYEIPEDMVEAFEAGAVSLRDLGGFVIRPMLYGYMGDARNTMPGSMMSYRGYPTPIINTTLLTKFLASSKGSLLNGTTNGSSGGKWTTVVYGVTVAEKLPYDTIHTVSADLHSSSGTMNLNSCFVLIASGQNVISAYKLLEEDPWTYITGGKIFFTVNTASLTGQITIETTPSNFLQAPYHGTLNPISVVLEHAEYNQASPAGYMYGLFYRNPSIDNIDCFVNSCNKISEANLFNTSSEVHELYLKNADSLTYGVDVFSNKECTVKATVGRYVMATFLYYHAESDRRIYTIDTIVGVDSSGKISTLHVDISAGADDCLITNPCA